MIKTKIVKYVKNSTSQTKILTLVQNSFSKNLPVVLPTETVYGLAAKFNDKKTVDNIFKIKGRPMDNPLIVHIADIKQFDLISAVPFKKLDSQIQLMLNNLWPGPLTVIVKANKNIVPNYVTANLDSVAIRMPSHSLMKSIIHDLNTPLVAPSANKSGRPSATNVNHAHADFNNEVELIIDDGDSEIGIESTVIDLTTKTPTLLRPGKIMPSQLLVYLDDILIADHVIDPGSLNLDAVVKSPGMKYTHYAPEAEVIAFNKLDTITMKINDTDLVILFSELDYPKENELLIKNLVCIESVELYEKMLFNLYRNADNDGIKRVFCQLVPNTHGIAINNRIKKSATKILD